VLLAVNRPAHLHVEVRDYDGALVAASGIVTVAVRDVDGDLVVSGSATSSQHGHDLGIYTYTLPTAVTGTLGVYEATAGWTYAGATSSVTYGLEVVGNALFEIHELRAFRSGLDNENTYTADEIRDARDAATQVLEQAAQVAFATRRTVQTLSGDNTTRLMLPHVKITALHSATVYGEDTGVDLVDDALDGTELADVEIDYDAGVLVRTSGVWPRGHRNIVVDYEHGYENTPGPVKRAAMLLAVEALVPSALPPRATAQSTDLGDFRISLANPDAGRDTGIPEVDAVIASWGCRRPRIG